MGDQTLRRDSPLDRAQILIAVARVRSACRGSSKSGQRGCWELPFPTPKARYVLHCIGHWAPFTGIWVAVVTGQPLSGLGSRTCKPTCRVPPVSSQGGRGRLAAAQQKARSSPSGTPLISGRANHEAQWKYKYLPFGPTSAPPCPLAFAWNESPSGNTVRFRRRALLRLARHTRQVSLWETWQLDSRLARGAETPDVDVSCALNPSLSPGRSAQPPANLQSTSPKRAS